MQVDLLIFLVRRPCGASLRLLLLSEALHHQTRRSSLVRFGSASQLRHSTPATSLLRCRSFRRFGLLHPPKASEQLRGCLCLEAEREADDMSLKFFRVAHAGCTSLLGWISTNPVADSELMVSVSACLFLVFVYFQDR